MGQQTGATYLDAVGNIMEQLCHELLLAQAELHCQRQVIGQQPCALATQQLPVLLQRGREAAEHEECHAREHAQCLHLAGALPCLLRGLAEKRLGTKKAMYTSMHSASTWPAQTNDY